MKDFFLSIKCDIMLTAIILMVVITMIIGNISSGLRNLRFRDRD